MRKTLIALSLVTLMGASACGSQPDTVRYNENGLRYCTTYEDEVLDLDDKGECAEDEEAKKKKKPVAPKPPVTKTSAKPVPTKAASKPAPAKPKPAAPKPVSKPRK